MSLGSFVLGSLAWSASEYAIHRFVGHGPKRPPPRTALGRFTLSGLAAEFNGEHLAHHTDPTYFAPTARKALAAALVMPVMAAALTPLVGLRRAAAFTFGFGAAYGAYEVVHRRIHTHPPRGRYGRWLRRNHLLHHYKSPRGNHGVTSPLWDLAFGSRRPLERVRVPRKTAPVWLTRDDDDYELVGTPAPASVRPVGDAAGVRRRAPPPPRAAPSSRHTSANGDLETLAPEGATSALGRGVGLDRPPGGRARSRT
jgi:hypothetical protein